VSVARLKPVARRFNDPAGLRRHGYTILLALALFAWSSRHSRGLDARRVLYNVMAGFTKWYRERVAHSIIDALDSWGYLDFSCQSPWRPGGWRRCPREWKLTERGYARLQELLGNLGLTLDDILQQPSPSEVKALIDGRIRQLYREHWERVRRYEEAARGAGL
jgi:hypothetical protein